MASVASGGALEGSAAGSDAAAASGVATAETAAGAVGPARTLTAASLAAAVIGETIGVSIFLTPPEMTHALASPFWLLVVWVLMGAMTFCGVVCYARLAARHPEPGGTYVYLREAYGPRLSFLYGWICLLAIDPGLTGALALGLSSYAARALPLTPATQKLLALALIAVMAVLNVLGTRLAAGVLRAGTWLKLALLGTLIVYPMASGLGHWSHFSPFVARPRHAMPLLAGLGQAAYAAFICFGGWWDASKIAAEVSSSDARQKRALLVAVSLVTALYVAVSVMLIYLIPMSRAPSSTFIAEIGAMLFGPVGERVLAAVVTLCVFSSLASIMTTAPRVYYAMARNRLFLPSVGRLHPRFGTPAVAIVIQATLASALVLVGSFQALLAYFISITVVFLGLAVGALLVDRRDADGRRGDLVLPSLFVVSAAVVLALALGVRPREALLGCSLVVVGEPVYRLMRRRQRAAG